MSESLDIDCGQTIPDMTMRFEWLRDKALKMTQACFGAFLLERKEVVGCGAFYAVECIYVEVAYIFHLPFLSDYMIMPNKTIQNPR